jgi:hypothetical protein
MSRIGRNAIKLQKLKDSISLRNSPRTRLGAELVQKKENFELG